MTEFFNKAKAAIMVRMWDWIIANLILLAAVWWIAPQQLQIVVYKTLLVALAAVLTYWIDHSLFKRTTDKVSGGERDFYSAMCMLRRAAIFVGCVLGLSLGT